MPTELTCLNQNILTNPNILFGHNNLPLKKDYF